jgi:hypothetical protein
VFDWDRHNLKKIKRHGVTAGLRLLAVVLTERQNPATWWKSHGKPPSRIAWMVAP